MTNFNTNGKFDFNKWVTFMNTAIFNLDESLVTETLNMLKILKY